LQQIVEEENRVDCIIWRGQAKRGRESLRFEKENMAFVVAIESRSAYSPVAPCVELILLKWIDMTMIRLVGKRKSEKPATAHDTTLTAIHPRYPAIQPALVPNASTKIKDLE
jgi:hypothetical protein